jgi:uncharacterized repeat protein (TIGR03833 family)
VPDARVNIVLKVDQPTGRTVSGTVKDVLTRGNHPRGIKVRLADGRIGRVQSLASAATTSTNTSTPDNNTLDTPPLTDETIPEDPRSDRHRRAFRPPRRSPFRDIRDEEQPTASIGLDAYLKPAKQRRSAKGKSQQGLDWASTPAASSEACASPLPESLSVSACPVCGDFEGDADAVAHHVASHFDD